MNNNEFVEDIELHQADAFVDIERLPQESWLAFRARKLGRMYFALHDVMPHEVSRGKQRWNGYRVALLGAAIALSAANISTGIMMQTEPDSWSPTDDLPFARYIYLPYIQENSPCVDAPELCEPAPLPSPDTTLQPEDNNLVEV